eukprot:8046916-Heterocapsa_arctica.AAC.1
MPNLDVFHPAWPTSSDYQCRRTVAPHLQRDIDVDLVQEVDTVDPLLRGRIYIQELRLAGAERYHVLHARVRLEQEAVE